METKTRSAIENELHTMLGHSQETEILIDWVRDLWETQDLLEERFGPELARGIIDAPTFLPEREVITV